MDSNNTDSSKSFQERANSRQEGSNSTGTNMPGNVWGQTRECVSLEGVISPNHLCTSSTAIHYTESVDNLSSMTDQVYVKAKRKMQAELYKMEECQSNFQNYKEVKNFEILSLYDDCVKFLQNDEFGYRPGSQRSSGTWSQKKEQSTSAQLCVSSVEQCLDLIEAAANGSIPTVKRRLSFKEKECIKPGVVYVYGERESGIRRWTDKNEWTPSRVSGQFLTYRSLTEDLVKKTYSKMHLNEIFHVVAYTNSEHERKGACSFCKVKGGQRATQPRRSMLNKIFCK